jgi:hypothetical protein
VILSAAGTTDLRPLFPQKPLRFLRAQAFRNAVESHDAEAVAVNSGQKPAFTQNLKARVNIEG